MKILQLDLRAFGPFTDVQIDLSGGSQGLHVIYGPNEAGKSSALRAIQQMLFQIPGNSMDNFIHPHPKLRIGATLRDRHGHVLQFLRRKGHKGTLLEADNRTPCDEQLLAAMLGGVDRDTFVSTFGIDHQELVRGGQEIVAGRGRVGELLFAVGAGIADLQAIRRQLAEEAELLFVPRGHTRQLNRKLRALDEARKLVRQAQLPSMQWDEHDRALKAAQSRLAQVEQELGRQVHEKSRLERFQQAMPVAGQRKARLGQLAELGQVKILPQNFADQRRQVVTDLTLARQQQQRARQELERIDGALGAIELPESILATAEAIQQLPDALGSHRKAQGDRPALEAKRQHLEAGASAILRQLRPDVSLESVESMRLTVRQRVQIQNLSQRSEALRDRMDRARAEMDQADSARGRAQEELGRLHIPGDPQPLAAAVRRTLGEGDLEQRLGQLQGELNRAHTQAAVDLEKLELWSGPAEALEKLPLPSPETIDRFDQQLAECAQTIRAEGEKLQKAKSDLARCVREMDALRLAGDVPTEEELNRARAVRDLGWQVIRQEWQRGESDVDQYEEFITRFEGRLDLAGAYEDAVAGADQLADRLRWEADRVAQRAGLQATRDEAQRHIARLEDLVGQAGQRRQQVQQEWVQCWQAAGIAPLSPREMQGWLRRQQALAEQARAIRNRRSEMKELDLRIGDCRRRLGQCLDQMGQPGPEEEETLKALVDRAQHVVDQVESVAARRGELEREIGKLQEQLGAARAAAEQARAEHSAWQADWARAIEPLGLGADESPAVVIEFLARLGELFQQLKDAQGLAERSQLIACDAEALATHVADLARAIDPALAEQPCQRAAQALIDRLAKARSDQQRQSALADERRRYENELAEADRRIETFSTRLSVMCREAECERPDQLPQAEQASETVVRLRQILADLDDQLLHLSAGAPIEAFLDQMDAVDADDLPARLDQLNGQSAQLEAERGELRERIGSERKELETMDARADAADAAEQAQHLLAQIQTDVHEYVRLRVAWAVLQEAIERYREKNEAPVLARATDLFGRLTGGSFQELLADFDDQGEKVLMGDRGDGSPPVALAGMSDGTCDQLYLALRLASLENYLADQEPIPFIVDDILISFDNNRAAAALEVLGDLSAKTQVIFFTHHRHLMHLAQESLSQETLFMHHLPDHTPAPASV